MLSTLATTDALAKLLIEKGVITDANWPRNCLRSAQYISGSSTQLVNIGELLVGYSVDAF